MKHVVICTLCSAVRHVSQELPTGWCCPVCTAKQYLGAMRQAGSNADSSLNKIGLHLRLHQTQDGWEIRAMGYIKDYLCFPVLYIIPHTFDVCVCSGIDAYLWVGQLQKGMRSYWRRAEDEQGTARVLPPHIHLTRLPYRMDQLNTMS